MKWIEKAALGLKLWSYGVWCLEIRREARRRETERDLESVEEIKAQRETIELKKL